MSRRPGPALPPTWTRRSPSIATSPAKASPPVPSRIVPPRMTMSCISPLPPAFRPAAWAGCGIGRNRLAAHGPMPQRHGPKRREERMSEQQRAALVTGAAGGIGREMVLGLVGNGLRVAAVDRDARGLAALAQAVQQRRPGADVMTIEADLARDAAIDEIVAKARGHLGVIDILVNNAGVGQATIRRDNRQRP